MSCYEFWKKSQEQKEKKRREEKGNPSSRFFGKEEPGDFITWQDLVLARKFVESKGYV